MNVTINGQIQEIEDSVSLNDIIQQFNKTNARIVAEVNGEIVKNPRWNEITINDGDKIELVSFVGGG